MSHGLKGVWGRSPHPQTLRMGPIGASPKAEGPSKTKALAWGKALTTTNLSVEARQ